MKQLNGAAVIQSRAKTQNRSQEELIEVEGVVFCGKQAAVVKGLIDRISESEYQRFYGEPLDVKCKY